MEPLVSFLVNAASGTVAVFFGSLWAVSRFYRQKTWERRERAYEDIINSLYDVIQYCKIQKEDYGQGTGLSKEAEHEFYAKYHSAIASLGKATDIGSFYISNEAYSVLQSLRERERSSPDEEPWFEIFESEYQEHEKALAKLMEIAKRDLHVGKT